MPEVTPRGNPKNPSTAGNAGIVVATPALAPTGAQQWMCAALVIEVKSLNVALTVSVSAVGSSTIVARPVPGDTTEGVCTSFAAERLAMKVIGSAVAAGADSIRAAVMTKAGETYRISVLPKMDV